MEKRSVALAPSRRSRDGQQPSRRASSAGYSRRGSDSVGSQKCKSHRGGRIEYGRGAISKNAVQGSAWRYNKRATPHLLGTGADTQGTASAHTDSGFYHEHENLEADPEVMRKATEYVSKILHAAKKDGAQQEAKPHEDQKLNPCRPLRGRRRKHSRNVSTAATTTNGPMADRTSRQGKAHAKRTTSNGDENGVGHPTPEEEHQQDDRSDLAAANVQDPANSCHFPFPSGNSRHDLNHPVMVREMEDAREGTCSSGGPETSCEENDLGTARPKTDDDNQGRQKKDKACSSPMTPLSFDVFCSLRPTLFRETGRVKQIRSGPNVHKDVRGLSGKECGNDKGKDIGRRCRGQLSTASHRGAGLEERTAAGAWTSIFGAVCAGAERGRARAEVLEAARREVVRLKRKRRRVTAATATPPVQFRRTRDKPASATSKAVGRPRDDLRSSAEPAKDGVVDMVEEEKPQTTVRSADKNNGMRLDAENGVTDDSALCNRIRGDTDQHNEEDVEVVALTADADDTEKSSDVVDIESCKSTPSGRHRMPESANVHRQRRQPRDGVPTSPLFRYPFGGGTTCIAVNAPRSLQVCPGDHGYCGVRVSSSPQRRRGLQGHQTQEDRSPPRRPSTASGRYAVCRRTVAIGNDAGGERGIYLANVAGAGLGLKRGERPETAWSFFSKGKPKTRCDGERFHEFERKR